MKIVHITTYPNGGAGNATLRMHKSLLKLGVDSKVITRDQSLENEGVFSFNRSVWFRRFSTLWKSLKIFPRIYREDENCEGFSSPISLYKLHEHPFIKEADIIFVHWVSNFFDYKSFFENSNKPIYFYLHDMNHFLGGFHYKNDIERFPKFSSLENYFEKMKRKVYQNKKIEVMAPSNWMLENSRKSQLLGDFKHVKCHYPIDQEKLKIYNNQEARAHFKLPKEGRVLLFISEKISNYRKGGKLLFEALQKANLEKIHLLVVGNYDQSIFQSDNIYATGMLRSEKEMALAYSASDLFILPSREDNMPNVMLESLFCGTPVMSFSNGGMKEVLNKSNGIILPEISSDCLAKGLEEWNEGNIEYDRQLIRRKAVELFNIEVAGLNLKKIIEERLKKENTIN